MPFKKGQSGNPKTQMKKGETLNPNGRPKKLPELDKLLADVLGDEKEGVTAAETILKALRLKAIKGDVRAIELLLDRAYGKLQTPIKQDLNVSSVDIPIEKWINANINNK